jgi:phage tail sheath protein FI
MVGVDTVPRKGMYALRSSGASVAMLADVDDLTTWSVQVAYGLSEGTYMICVGPAGDTIANAVTTRASVGVDSYAFKPIFGDYCYWADPVNGVTRLVSPQAFCAGRLANLAPQHSSLNKPIYGVVATQKTSQNLQYSTAELQTLIQAGWDVLTNPVPGGSYFGMRVGHNGSSNPAIQGDNYTRMTNYEASTLGAGMGRFVGRLQSSQANDPVRSEVKGTLDSFLQAQVDQKQIDSFTTQCDLNNNSQSRIAAGYLQADVAIRYLGVVEKFLVNTQGGQTVVTRQSTQG